jgi:hypothetical protein
LTAIGMPDMLSGVAERDDEAALKASNWKSQGSRDDRPPLSFSPPLATW